MPALNMKKKKIMLFADWYEPGLRQEAPFGPV